jgi:D-glycero-alpha-D-manno-heptose 1-phosphate guanylyltransferase
MQAVVLVGGLGTRLRPLVSDIPKPMALVRGRPFLSYLLDFLAVQGITEAILAVGYLRDRLMEVFGERHGTLRLRYSVEETALGTGGAIRQAFGLVDSWPVFAVNGDTFLDVDYKAMRRAHETAGAFLTMALAHVADAGRYGRAVVTDGRVVGFEPSTNPGPGVINAGVYLFSHDPLAWADLPRAFSLEKDFLALQLANLRPLAFNAPGYFIDIGVPEDYRRAQHELGEWGKAPPVDEEGL